MGTQDDTLKQINKSGFPFQLRIEHEIRSSHQQHGWSVASREHPWTSADKENSGFIDLVLQHDQISPYRLVIECKRIKSDDDRQLRWVFLLPDQNTKETELASCFEVESTNTPDQPPGLPPRSRRKDIQIWDNVLLSPSSLQSEFCILQGDEPKRQPILERLASEVLESIEGLANEEIRIEKSQNSNHLRLFIFPAIVTNAEISVCRFNSSSVSIDAGTLGHSDVEISTVPFIRFRKSLATNFPEGVISDLKSAAKARERTVFIVNAESLTEFLKDWKVGPTNRFNGFAIENLTGR